MLERPTPRLPDPSAESTPRRAGRSAEQANVATFAALFGLGLFAFSLIAIVSLVLPQVRGLVLVLFGAIGFFAAHYVVWGWWLPKALKPKDRDEA